MTWQGWAEIALTLALTVAVAWPAGLYLARVLQGASTWLDPIIGPVERVIYRGMGPEAVKTQSWIGYTGALLAFNGAGFALLYVVLLMQGALPLNPLKLAGLSPDLAFNTAISFVTNTNWQAYAGETTMSNLSQMVGLTVQNFLSGATGIAIVGALARAFAAHRGEDLGNFWKDVVRVSLYVLLPLSVVMAFVLALQGVPQTLAQHIDITTLEGAKQTIAVGPVASQVAIKMLGTNGGGFFNANSAHPFENPTGLVDYLQIISIFALGAGLTNMFGRMVGNERQGWAIFAAMGLLFLAGVAVLYGQEAHANKLLTALGMDGSMGNMEGKEVRFGIAGSALFSTVTTDASCGAVNSMIESFLPLGGLIPMLNIMLGEIIFGGVGSGLYGFLLFAIVSVFVAGLMVGRTPEYLGKKIEAREVKMTMLAILCLPLVMLGFTAVAVVVDAGTSALSASGPHGFSEALYAYVSAAGNNGSAFAGISANTPFWNTTLGIGMMIGRFFVIIPALAIAGSMAAKKIVPPSSGTFPTDGPMFVGLVIGVILIVGGLTFFPALALGPIVEHFALAAGTTY